MDAWMAATPPITKWFIVGAMGLTLAGNFSILNPYLLLLDFDLIFNKFQIWRLVTAFMFMGKLGFPFLINMMYFYTHSKALEEGSFMGDTAKYLWMFVVTGSLLLLAGYLMEMPILGNALIMVVIYVWSQRHAEENMSFFFGIRFKAIMFPWALVALTVLLGGSPVIQLLGIAVGHFYYFLEDLYPMRNGGVRYLTTPQFMYKLVGGTSGGVQGGFRQPGVVPPPRRFGGAGHRLGGD